MDAGARAILDALRISARGSRRAGEASVRIKDEEAIASVDKEFAMFMASEKQRTAQALAQAKKLKTIATVLAFILVLSALAAAAYMYFLRRGTGSLMP